MPGFSSGSRRDACLQQNTPEQHWGRLQGAARLRRLQRRLRSEKPPLAARRCECFPGGSCSITKNELVL